MMTISSSLVAILLTTFVLSSSASYINNWSGHCYNGEPWSCSHGRYPYWNHGRYLPWYQYCRGGYPWTWNYGTDFYEDQTDVGGYIGGGYIGGSYIGGGYNGAGYIGGGYNGGGYIGGGYNGGGYIGGNYGIFGYPGNNYVSNVAGSTLNADFEHDSARFSGANFVNNGYFR